MDGAPAPPDSRRAAVPGATLLIIDDDPVITFLLRSVLERAGYRCLVARDGESAWQVLSPDVALVLLDIMMPGQNGPEILRRMRLDPMLADIPVIFVTGRSDAATRIQCLAMGAAGFVVKPVQARDVLNQVRLALERPDIDDLPDDESDDPLEAALETEFAPTSGLGGELTPSEIESMPVSHVLRSLLAERRSMRRSLSSHRRLVSALFRLHQVMSEGQGPAELGQSIVALAQKALRATHAELWVPDCDGLVRLAGLTSAQVRSRARDGADDVPPAAARAWREWLTVESDAGECEAGELEMHFPLTVGTERIGVLSLCFPADVRPSASLSGFFCAEVALALESAIRLERARSEALTDPLTGVYNRRFLEGRLDDELRRARALGASASVLFIDIDRFKWFNDTFGHEVGDRLLCRVADALRAQLRSVDVVARFGGDEFVVVLPETDRAGSAVVAARLQEGLIALTDATLPDEASLTVTIGAATYPEDGTRPAELLASADAAMLRGKRAGRNRIEIFGRERPRAASAAHRRETTVVLRSLLAALEMRDPYTARHSRAVAALASRMARRLGCDPEEVRLVGQAGLLHDVGKLHTPIDILRKPGPLDEHERLVMNQHAHLGAELAASQPAIRHLAGVVRASQEFFDGGGYPDGLAGEAIPLAARIIAVADAYHAMRSDRPYRAAIGREAAIAELARCAGTQFDPVVVHALVAVVAARDPQAASDVASAA